MTVNHTSEKKNADGHYLWYSIFTESSETTHVRILGIVWIPWIHKPSAYHLAILGTQNHLSMLATALRPLAWMSQD